MLERYSQLSTRYLHFFTQKHLKLFFLKNPCFLEIHVKIFIEEMIQYLESASKYSSGKRWMCEFSLNQIDEVVVVEVKVSMTRPTILSTLHMYDTFYKKF